MRENKSVRTYCPNGLDLREDFKTINTEIVKIETVVLLKFQVQIC